MRVCTATLIGASAYSSSRPHDTERLERETPDAFERRTWKEKAHVHDGKVFIPPMAFQMSLNKAAAMLGMKIPGKRNATYTKFFVSGVMVNDLVYIADYDPETIECEKVFANADGKRGSGTRVWRWFPVIRQWESKVRFYVLANEITDDVFKQHLVQAGMFVGVGRFRPENGGFFGRFAVKDTVWSQS